MDFVAIIFWTGVGVPGFSEKSASEMENYEAREEEENSLEIDAYLSFLVYLGRAKLKNIPRGRVVRPMFEEPPFPFSSRVVSIVFGFRFSILLNILGDWHGV